MPSSVQQLCIDGQWISCSPALGYGVLGVRYLCYLGTSAGQPGKRLLIRPRVWPQAQEGNREAVAKLTPGKIASTGLLGLRPVVASKYQRSIPQTDGSPRTDICPVLQQDVTGLVPLKQAILGALKSSRPQQVWQLFYYACKALDDLGQAIGADRPVPLQCPESLVVDADNRVVPLDAEILVAGSFPADSGLGRLYQSWFGEAGRKGFADAQAASVMHANALLLYFRQVLAEGQQHGGAGDSQLPAVIATPLQRMRPGASLEDFESWIRGSAEDWNIAIEDENDAPAAAIPRRPAEGAPIPIPSRKKRSLVLRLSLCLNLILIAALTVLLLLWPERNGALSASGIAGAKQAETSATGEDALFFSSYCVVFPTQGTISEKVGAALQELFPDQFREMRRNAPDHGKLLQEKMDECIKSISEPDKLKRLLIRLGTEHSIRFKGFNASDPNEGLTAVIERGGIFTMAAASPEQHGSLLQTNGLEKVLAQAGLRDDREAQQQLDSLKKAIAEYASLKDALSIIGDRTAYLLHVEQATAAAHERMRRKLLSRLDKPVFISRPIPEFFDAVDPTADTGGGVASYSLRLDRKCFWRLASKEDRRNIDYASTADKERMKWRSFEAGQPILWRPISLIRQNGKADTVASFDITVMLGTKVVVFRNQSLLVGDSRKQIFDQGRNYISKALGLRIDTVEDAISVRQQEGQFTGTLIYSYLAEKVSSDNRSSDLELMDLAVFEQLKMREDNF